jgi:hypothetical protein
VGIGRGDVVLTLTDFLLARIAETERRCGDVHHVNCAYARVPERECTCGNPARVLARCAADRRIVERYAYIDDGNSLILDPADGQGWFTLCDLALPYADHADYREEWKP